MRYILSLFLIFTSLFSLQTSDKLFECTEIFQERKSELLVELERIDEQKQSLSALKTATEELLKQKGLKLDRREEILNTQEAKISKKEKITKDMLTKNKAILKELKELKMDKIAQTFAKMKAGASAKILSDMDAQDAVAILQSLKPKTVGKILTKMDAKKASKLTQILAK